MHPDNPLYKKEMLVEIPNNFSGALEFKNGVLCSILISSEGINVTNHFTVYGSTGALTFNDPNEFGRPLYLKCKGDKEAREITLTNTYNINMRGLRAADLAYAIRNGRASGSSLEMVYHTFEAEIGICSSGEDNTTHIMQSTSERPKLLEMGNTEYPEIVLDL
jgi:predicted dehydrogenase